MGRGVRILGLMLLLTLVVPINVSKAEDQEIKFFYHSRYGGYNSSVYHIRLNTYAIGNLAYYEWNESYCADPHQYIFTDRLYLANFQRPPDTEKWRSINYIITWFHKIGNYTDGVNEPAYENNQMTPEESKAIGQAMWYFTVGLEPTDDFAKTIIDEAIGKDVIRETDSFTLNMTHIESEGFFHNVTIIVKVLDENGVGREGVKLIIAGEEANLYYEPSGTLVHDLTGWTDHEGEYSYMIINPSLRGNTTTSVTTLGRQVKLLNNVTDFQHYETYQPLITLNNHTYVKYEDLGILVGHWKLGFEFFHIPEFPLGTVLPIISSLAALTLFYRKKRR